MLKNYFEHKLFKWNIIDFINETDIETFNLTIDFYIKSLEGISNLEQDDRQKKAQKLLDEYRKASDSFYGGSKNESSVMGGLLGHRHSRLLAELQNQYWDTGGLLGYLCSRLIADPVLVLSGHRKLTRLSVFKATS